MLEKVAHFQILETPFILVNQVKLFPLQSIRKAKNNSTNSLDILFGTSGGKKPKQEIDSLPLCQQETPVSIDLPAKNKK